MGKGSRNRKQRSPEPSSSTGPYFHGGVPDKEPRDVLLPATQLGFRYNYHALGAPYDPGWVYLTTDERVASAYASRYLDGHGRAIPGDVHEVQPMDRPQVDPDYHLFPDIFLRCKKARIVRTVAHGVVLTKSAQAQLERPYVVWGSADLPVWDQDGLVIPSDQMAANGVTRQWTTMLRPWLGTADIDALGRLTIARRADDMWRTILDVIPSLDRDCQIQANTRWRRRRSYLCITCGRHLDDSFEAALHQLGGDAVTLLASIHHWTIPNVVPELIKAARARNSVRWKWLQDNVTN